MKRNFRNALGIMLSMAFFWGCLGTGGEGDSTNRDFAPLTVGNTWKYSVYDSGSISDPGPYSKGVCSYVRTLRLDSLDEGRDSLGFSLFVRDSGIAWMFKVGCLCADSLPCGCQDTVKVDTSFRISGSTSSKSPSIIMKSHLIPDDIDFVKYKTFDKNVVWKKTDTWVKYDSLILSGGSVFVKTHESNTGYKLDRLDEALYREDVGLYSAYKMDCLIGYCSLTRYELKAFLPSGSP